MKILGIALLLSISLPVYAKSKPPISPNPPPSPPIVEACKTLDELKIMLAPVIGDLTPAILTGSEAVKATAYINRIGDPTNYKADTLYVIPSLKKKEVVVWFIKNNCVDPAPVIIPVKAFMAAVAIDGKKHESFRI